MTTGFWRSPHLGRRLFFGMLALAIVFTANGAYRATHAARFYDAAYVGMSRNEVRYLFGVPASRGAADALWRIGDADRVMSFRFDAVDRLAAVGCAAAPNAEGATCPAVLGIGIGTDEDAVWQTLGGPAAERYGGDSKVMSYPGIGARFRLRRAQVVAIEHRRYASKLALLGAVLMLLAP